MLNAFKYFAEVFKSFMEEHFQKLPDSTSRFLHDLLRERGVCDPKEHEVSISKAVNRTAQEDVQWPSNKIEKVSKIKKLDKFITKVRRKPIVFPAI